MTTLNYITNTTPNSGGGIGSSSSSNISQRRQRISSQERINRLQNEWEISTIQQPYNNDTTTTAANTTTRNHTGHVAIHMNHNNHHHHPYDNDDHSGVDNNSSNTMMMIDLEDPNSGRRSYHDDDDNYYYQQQQQQYQHIGGQSIMTEEKLRRFTELQQQPQYYHHHHHISTSMTPNSYDTTITPLSQISTTTIANNNHNHTSTQPTILHQRDPLSWKHKLQEEKFYRIEDYHTIFRIPHHVSDANYHKYIYQQLHHYPTDQQSSNSMVLSKSCCAYTCMIFSAIAIVFLIFIALLLDTQPLYIPGTLPAITIQSTIQYNMKDGSSKSYTQPKVQFLIPGPNDERLPIVTTAYQAAGMYFITMILSLYIYHPKPFHRIINYIQSYIYPYIIRKKQLYTDIPDTTSTFRLPSYNMIGHNQHMMHPSMIQPETMILGGGTGNSMDIPSIKQSKSISSLYQVGIWNRSMNTMKRYLAIKGWYYQPRQNKHRRRRHKEEPKKTG